MVEDDMDQALAYTKVCAEWTCADWVKRKSFPNAMRVQPKLVKKGAFWCCPKCGSSYGANPHPDLN